MRAHEFVTEAGKAKKPVRKAARDAAPNMTFHDHEANSMTPYQAYRFAVSLAHSPETRNHNATHYADTFAMIDYSDADAEIRKAAEKAMGIKSNHSTGRGSKELDTTNKTSPVAKPKRNKYGV